jgi:flagella basal body P-ring formation protein FlgA
MAVTIVTTLGASQPTWTPVASDPGTFRGFSIHRHVAKSTAGVAQYAVKDAVDVCRKGLVWMMVVTGVTMAVDETAYINLAIAGQEGKVTNVSSGNIVTGGVVRKVSTDPDGLAIAAIEINLP